MGRHRRSLVTMRFLGLHADEMVEFNGIFIHPRALPSLQSLIQQANLAGFQVQLVSGFRSFERQLSIWNRKSIGELPVLDEYGNPLERHAFDDEKWMWNILNWSALPGTSRHHWGSDIDLVGQPLNLTPKDPELVPSEYQEGGPFFEFDTWIHQRLLQDDCCGFAKPFVKDRGGVKPEPWHFSWVPLSNEVAQEFHIDLLHKTLANSNLELKKTILTNLPDIVKRMVQPYLVLHE